MKTWIWYSRLFAFIRGLKFINPRFLLRTVVNGFEPTNYLRPGRGFISLASGFFVTGGGQRGTWNGTLDLTLEQPDGTVVVFDHKSAPIRRSSCDAKATQYSGQLSAYREMLSSNGATIHSTWIHFPLAGVVSKIENN